MHLHDDGYNTNLSLDELRALDRQVADIEDFEQAVQLCAQTLQETCRELLTRHPDRAPAVLFSGGLDSSLVAAQLRALGTQPVLYVTAQPQARDLRPSEAFAEAMGLELRVCSLSADDAQRLPQLLRYAATKSLYGVAAAIMERLAADAARADGHTELWTGTGADLLFHGGRRADEFGDLGTADFAPAAREAMLATWHWRFCFDQAWEDALPHVNPLATLAMMRCARRISPLLLWHGGEDKAPLRELARRLGVPEDVSARGKDPAQASSGLFDALTQLMVASVDEQTEHRVSHGRSPLEDPLLALRVWVAWQAERAGVQTRPDQAPLAPLAADQLRALLH